MNAAETYAAYIDAANAQRARIQGEQPSGDRWGGPIARRLRNAPRRELDPNLEVIASYVRPEDVLIDVGGGAGRVSLPMAMRCREVINVDPSPGMAAEFTGSAEEGGITNARFVQAGWLEAEGIQGDVAITSNVTYFVRDIAGFVRKMEAAARRRVMITVWSVANPNQDLKPFQLIYGEEKAAVPGHRELLPVLWDLGILPDVRVLPGLPQVPGGPMTAKMSQTREEAIQSVLSGNWHAPKDQARVRSRIEAHFHELFAQRPGGFHPLWRQEARELLITWETEGRR